MTRFLRPFSAVLGALALLASAASAQSSGLTFTTTNIGTYPCNISYASGGQPTTVDLNGDGLLDYSNQSARIITVLQRSQAGGFEQLSFPLPLLGSVYQHFWSDCNSDGKPDLILKVVGGGPGSGGQIWFNDGVGHLSYGASFPLIELENIMNVADLDGDGVAEIVTVDFNRPIGVDENSFYLLQSTGTATYAPRKLLHLAKGLSFIGDFNGDGRKDIALFKYTNKSDRRMVRIFSNNGNRTYKDNGDIKLGAGDMVGAADLTGDGKCDLFGYYGAILRTDSLSKLTPLTYPSPLQFLGNNRFYVGDFNGDGRTDYLNTGMDFQGTWGSTLYAGTPTGALNTFSSSINLGDYTLSSNASFPSAFAAVTDYNGDGKSDLVRFTFDTITGTTQVDVLTAN